MMDISMGQFFVILATFVNFINGVHLFAVCLQNHRLPTPAESLFVACLQLFLILSLFCNLAIKSK